MLKPKNNKSNPITAPPFPCRMPKIRGRSRTQQMCGVPMPSPDGWKVTSERNTSPQKYSPTRRAAASRLSLTLRWRRIGPTLERPPHKHNNRRCRRSSWTSPCTPGGQAGEASRLSFYISPRTRLNPLTLLHVLYAARKLLYYQRRLSAMHEHPRLTLAQYAT